MRQTGSRKRRRPPCHAFPIVVTPAEAAAIAAGQQKSIRRRLKPQPKPFVQTSPDRHPPKHPAPYVDSYCSERKTDTNPRGMSRVWCWWTADDRQGSDVGLCPFGVPGDTLWVREAWYPYVVHSHADDACDCGDIAIDYPTDGRMRSIPDGSKNHDGTWVVADGWCIPERVRTGKYKGQPVPAQLMPRWAARIELSVTRIEIVVDAGIFYWSVQFAIASDKQDHVNNCQCMDCKFELEELQKWAKEQEIEWQAEQAQRKAKADEFLAKATVR